MKHLPTPRERAALIAWAKRKAVPFHSRVNAGIRVDDLMEDATEARYAALAVVLAAAVDPVRLRQVLAAEDDGTPAEVQEEALRWAHAEVQAMRQRHEPVPVVLEQLERKYQREAKQRARASRAA